MQIEHLRKRANFLAMRHKGQVLFTSAFTLQYAKNALIMGEKIVDKADVINDDAINIGFTVTKKVGNAVQRNKVKRRLREVFRNHFAPNCPNGYCYVMIGNPKMLRMDFEELIQNVCFALRKMEQAIATRQMVEA
jgi:ribonuclease P protein component